MRISVQIAVAAAALAAGCCTDRSQRCDSCCDALPGCQVNTPGHCRVTTPACQVPQAVPLCDAADPATPEPAQELEEAPRPPAETPAEAPTTAARPIPVDEQEPETEPVSIPVRERRSPVSADAGLMHGPNYSWLIGRLQRVHVPGGEWKIRYAAIDQPDLWGGSVVLAPDIRIEQFADGDIVYVEGEILAGRPSLYLSGPLYRVRTIRLAEGRQRERIAREIR